MADRTTEPGPGGAGLVRWWSLDGGLEWEVTTADPDPIWDMVATDWVVYAYSGCEELAFLGDDVD